MSVPERRSRSPRPSLVSSESSSSMLRTRRPRLRRRRTLPRSRLERHPLLPPRPRPMLRELSERWLSTTTRCAPSADSARRRSLREDSRSMVPSSRRLSSRPRERLRREDSQEVEVDTEPPASPNNLLQVKFQPLLSSKTSLKSKLSTPTLRSTLSTTRRHNNLTNGNKMLANEE